MRFTPALLEEWMREYYFDTDTDIGSSGVMDLSLAELRDLLGISYDDLDRIVLRDSTSWGNAGLRAAVARQWGNDEPEWVMATHGASEAIYLVLSTLLDPGDEVVALEPIYHSLISTVASAGCAVRPWKLVPEKSFAPDLTHLIDLVSDRTRMIVVNFPHNPTGVSLTEQEQAELVRVAADTGAYLVWDAAFSEILYDSDPLPHPTSMYPRAISIGTLSKAYGLPGLRFGWCIADPAILARLVHLRDRMTLHLSPLVEFLAQAVAENADLVLTRTLAHARVNRAAVLSWAEQMGDAVDIIPPTGGVTAFPRLIGFDDTEPLCRFLARESRVLLVPGNCFGHSDRVRLGFGAPRPQVAAGLNALSSALRSRGVSSC